MEQVRFVGKIISDSDLWPGFPIFSATSFSGFVSFWVIQEIPILHFILVIFMGLFFSQIDSSGALSDDSPLMSATNSVTSYTLRIKTLILCK